MLNFSEKYETQLDSWIKNKPTVSSLIIGPTGCGKTFFVTEYLKKHDYKIFLFNSHNFPKQQELANILDQIYQIKQFIIHHSKTAVVFDELESISINDKGCVSEIINFIHKLEKYRDGIDTSTYYNLNIPLICIGQDSYIKKIKDLKKSSTTITFEKPSNAMIKDMLKEQMDVKDENELVRQAKLVNNDFRKLKNVVELSKSSPNMLKSYNLYDITERILYDDEDIKSIIRHYDQQKILLPLMIHENYKHVLKKSKSLTTYMKDISSRMSYGDIVANDIYNNNEWDLGTYYAVLVCHDVSHYLKMIPEKDKNKKRKEMKYTMLRNRSSLKCTYRHTYNVNTMYQYDYFIDKDIVKFNTLKLMELYKKDSKNKKLFKMYDVDADKKKKDLDILIKLNNCL